VTSGIGIFNLTAVNVVSNYSLLGYTTIDRGNATIGAGASWTNTNNMVVGWNSQFNSNLVIQKGGLLANSDTGGSGSGIGGAFEAGDLKHTGMGSVDVTDEGSRWQESNSICIGCLGDGSLTIEKLGRVDCQSAQVADAIDPFTSVKYDAPGGSVLLDGVVTKPDGTVVKSTWNVATNLDIGVTGRGTVTVQNGAVLHVGKFISLGRETNGSGLLKILGGGTVVLGPGGFIDAGINSIPTDTLPNNIQVSGTGSTLDCGGGTLYISDGAASNLMIDTNGSVTNLGYLAVGTLARTAGGNVTISSSGSLATSFAHIGDLGSGSLIISDQGTFKLTGGGSLEVGSATGSNGIVTVQTSGQLDANQNNVYVGNDGFGRMNVSQGGKVVNLNFLSIGTRAGNTENNQVTVTGTNTAPSMLMARTIYVGDGGTGFLNVNSFGTVQLLAGGYLDVGFGAGSNGTATVAGGTLDANGNPIFVGDVGTGTLSVMSGSVVNASYLSIGTRDTNENNNSVMVSGISSQLSVGSLYVGDERNGTLTISGGGQVNVQSGAATIGSGAAAVGRVTVAGGFLDANGNTVFVGYSGKGTVLASAGGQLTNVGALYAAIDPHSSANIVISDANSNLIVSDQLTVGLDGTAVLAVSNGGFASARTITVGRLPGSNGEVDVVNPASILKARFLDIGGTSDNLEQVGGKAVVNTINQGQLFVSETVRLWANATLDATDGLVTIGAAVPEADFKTVRINPGGTLESSGTVKAIKVDNVGGTLKLGHSPGTLTIDGDYSQETGGTIVVELDGMAPGAGFGQLVVTGDASLDGTLDVSLAPGFVPQVGTTFDIVTAASVSGMFATVDVAGPVQFAVNDIPGGLELDVTQVPEPDAIWLLAAVGLLLRGRNYRVAGWKLPIATFRSY
jgi:T5SS/PEP-CTERM-associated repeat protein